MPTKPRNTEQLRVPFNHPTTYQLMRIVRFETAGLACKLICKQQIQQEYVRTE